MDIIHIRITAYIYAERDRGPAVNRLVRMNIEQKDAVCLREKIGQGVVIRQEDSLRREQTVQSIKISLTSALIVSRLAFPSRLTTLAALFIYRDARQSVLKETS